MAGFLNLAFFKKSATRQILIQETMWNVFPRFLQGFFFLHPGQVPVYGGRKTGFFPEQGRKGTHTLKPHFRAYFAHGFIIR